MRKVIFLVFLIFLTEVSAQENEEVLIDTVGFITTKINALEAVNYRQKIYTLNFEHCNLEYVRSFSDESEWLIYDFWLANISEDKMRLDFEGGEWKLKLVSPDKKIQFDATNSSGWVSEMHLSSKEKEPLIAIGKALYFAIKSCKGLDRFKE